MNDITTIIDPELMPALGGPPYALFAEWRESEPLKWIDPNPDYKSGIPGYVISKGMYVLTRYNDIYQVERDTETYSSAMAGAMIHDLSPEALAIEREAILSMDPPNHTKIKRLAIPYFMPRPLAEFAPEITSKAKEIVDSIADKGECEFVFDAASKLPAYTFCALMGIPSEYRDELVRLGNAHADYEMRGETGATPIQEIFVISERLSEEKRQNPDDSLLSVLVRAEIDGEPLTQDQINMYFVAFSVAGHETTRSTATNFIDLMCRYPDQYKLLLSDIDRYLPGAIDEVLRFAAPIVHFRRTVTKDTTLRGKELHRGDKILLSYPAANRDPEVFPEPDKFDITRENASKHLSFGTGPHVCLGARLAVLQLNIFLKEIVTRIPDFAQAGKPERLRSILLDAIEHMPITYTPEAK